MALRYIIDGYNVVKRVPAWSNLELQEARESFLKFIQTNKLTGSPRNKIIVVFDANSAYAFDDGLRGREHRDLSINVVFSRNKTADDRIIEILQAMSNPRDALIVSDDKQLRRCAREYGAQLMNVVGFLRRSRQDKTKGCDSGKCGLSARQARKITQELEKIWLKEK